MRGCGGSVGPSSGLRSPAPLGTSLSGLRARRASLTEVSPLRPWERELKPACKVWH